MSFAISRSPIVAARCDPDSERVPTSVALIADVAIRDAPNATSATISNRIPTPVNRVTRKNSWSLVGPLYVTAKALVKITGVRKATLPQEEVLKIVNELLRVRIFDAASEYDVRDSISSYKGRLTLASIVVTDAPSTYLELRIGDHARRVRLYYNVPKELGAIPDLIDQLVRIEQWIGTDCERPRSPIGPARPAGECER